MNIIKFGSRCLFTDYGAVNHALMRAKAQEVEKLATYTVIVASGAIAVGKGLENNQRPNSALTPQELQGYACTGQPALMQLYQQWFSRPVSQLLVTNTDLQNPNHVKDLIHHNKEKGRITVINYNDGVDFEQLRKDNDTLAVQIANYAAATRIVILGHYDGFKDPFTGRIIEDVSEVTDQHYALCQGAGEHGNGGFRTKLDAARLALKQDKELIIGNVNFPLEKLLSGKVIRTRFKNNGNKL